MRRGGDGGSIVNIITMASHGGEPVLTAYASSKGALATLTKNAGYQLQPDRIRVNGLNIGWTATEGEDATQRGTGRPADWREEADAASPLGRLLVPGRHRADGHLPAERQRAHGDRRGHRLRPDRARPLRAPHDPRPPRRAMSQSTTTEARVPTTAAGTIRLTTAQAIVRYLAAQHSVRDGRRRRLIPAMLGIFGHGNVAGLGQALDEYQARPALRPGPQRAVPGAHRVRLRQGQPPHGRARGHRVDRPGRREHGHRRRAGHRQPPPGAAAPRRHVRHAPAGPGAPAARARRRRATSRSTTASGRWRASSTASRARSSC